MTIVDALDVDFCASSVYPPAHGVDAFAERLRLVGYRPASDVDVWLKVALIAYLEDRVYHSSNPDGEIGVASWQWIVYDDRLAVVKFANEQERNLP